MSMIPTAVGLLRDRRYRGCTQSKFWNAMQEDVQAYRRIIGCGHRVHGRANHCRWRTQASAGAIRAVVRGRTKRGQRKDVWLRFGVWLLWGWNSSWLRTSYVPQSHRRGPTSVNWQPLALIRTFLNYFLEKDLERYEPNEAQTDNMKAVEAASLADGKRLEHPAPDFPTYDEHIRGK